MLSMITFTKDFGYCYHLVIQKLMTLSDFYCDYVGWLKKRAQVLQKRMRKRNLATHLNRLALHIIKSSNETIFFSFLFGQILSITLFRRSRFRGRP
jgi:hypothetical protein